METMSMPIPEAGAVPTSAVSMHASPRVFDRGIFEDLIEVLGDRLAADFLISLRREVTQACVTIQERAPLGDWSQVADAAHAIKALTGSCGLVELARLTANIQDGAERGDKLSVDKLMHKLPMMCLRSFQALDQYS